MRRSVQQVHTVWPWFCVLLLCIACSGADAVPTNTAGASTPQSVATPTTGTADTSSDAVTGTTALSETLAVTETVTETGAGTGTDPVTETAALTQTDSVTEATNRTADGNTEVALATRSWVLIAMGDAFRIPNTLVTLTFGPEGRLIGWTGCNQLTGTYAHDAAAQMVTIDDLTVAEADCPSGEMADAMVEQEQTYLSTLEAVTQYEIKGLELHLSDGDGSVVSRFRSALGDVLESTSWLVNAYDDGDGTLIDVTADPAISATFRGNSISGVTGCTNYALTYELDQNYIRIGDLTYLPLGALPAGCNSGGELQLQNANYLTALQAAHTFELSAPQLILADTLGNPLVVMTFNSAEASTE